MDIPIVYKNNDTVYHYTKLSTALEAILYNGKLRLSPRSGTVDPYENNKLFIQYSCINFPGAKIAKQEKGDEVKKRILDKYNSIRQISFCLNNDSIDIERQTGHGNLEYYSFIKPRMWEQYGDSYKGICLALSLEKIIKIIEKDGIRIIKDRIKYDKSRYIKSFDYGIDMNTLAETDSDEFIKAYFKRIEKRIFTKYQDYGDENEYKICAYSLEQFVPFDISDCIIGIIYCDKYIPEIYIDLLKKYAKDFKSYLTTISFGNQGINIKNEK